MALRLGVALAALGLTLAPRIARADCPDGWFCDEGPSASPPNAPAPSTPAPNPPPPPLPPSPLVPERLTEPEEPPPPPSGSPAGRSEVGFNMHLDLGLFGPGASHGAGLGGLGIAFRLRPLPFFAVDLGLEALGGNDYNGNDRAEQAFVANAVLFANPRDRVQVFLLAGFHFGDAEAHVTRLGGVTVPLHYATYTYFGLQGGLGVDWRFARAVALTGDFQLFARWRIDSSTDIEPEYVDPSSHLATNASGGGLFRLGVTFYF